MKFRYIYICAAVLLTITTQCNSETLPEATPTSDPEPRAGPDPTATPYAGPAAAPYADPYANPFANPNAYPYAYPYAEANPNLLTSMYERGRDLVEITVNTGIQFMGKMFRPTADSVFHLGKHIVFELPQEILLYIIQKFCTTALSNNLVNPQNLPEMSQMNFVFKGLKGDIVAPLDDSSKIWSHQDFKRDWNTVMIITGWNSNINNTNFALDILYAAYRTRDINFVFFDTAKFVDTLYAWSAFNTKGLGEIIGKSLVEFVKFVPVDKVHLVGHSLGAHICGFAGRTFTNLTDQYIPRITGLDPARPCFNQGHNLDGLSRGDAAFVDIIHTNPGALGKKATIGDVDFWPNGDESLQPGCFTLLCSHSRSFEYYAESVIRGNERNFMAVRCSSVAAYKRGECDGRPVPMGMATPSTAKGDFFLTTRMLPPFGKKSAFLDIAAKSMPTSIDFHN